MQYASCFVQLSGDAGTLISKAPVTPPEIVLLRAIHGQHAVSGVELIKGGANDKKPHAEELQRLRDAYTARNDDGDAIVDKVFPGHAPVLPTTFAEIGVGVGINEGKAVRPKGKGKAAVEAAEAAVGGDEEEIDTESED